MARRFAGSEPASHGGLGSVLLLRPPTHGACVRDTWVSGLSPAKAGDSERGRHGGSSHEVPGALCFVRVRLCCPSLLCPVPALGAGRFCSPRAPWPVGGTEGRWGAPGLHSGCRGGCFSAPAVGLGAAPRPVDPPPYIPSNPGLGPAASRTARPLQPRRLTSPSSRCPGAPAPSPPLQSCQGHVHAPTWLRGEGYRRGWQCRGCAGGRCHVLRFSVRPVTGGAPTVRPSGGPVSCSRPLPPAALVLPVACPACPASRCRPSPAGMVTT